MKYFKARKSAGFTVVEITVVIVIIAILAVITVYSYTAVRSQGTESALKGNLKNAAEEIEFQKIRNKSYPATINDIEKGIAGTDTVTYQYYRVGLGYCLMGTAKRDSSIMLSINQSGHFSKDACVAPTPTAEACFDFNASTRAPARAIIGYFEYEGNDSSNPACPRDVIVPATIIGVSVQRIAENAFYGQNITSVELPASVQDIQVSTFKSNPNLSYARISSTATVTDAFDPHTIIMIY